VFNLSDSIIGVIGLGYVGLPIAVEFGRQHPTLGFDINAERTAELKAGKDSTLEITPDELEYSKYLTFIDSLGELSACNVYIVAVPTPIDKYKRPDLQALEQASRSVGRVLSPGNVVIYESTVFPGAIEEICVPLLEVESGLTFNRGFFVGYSPERINPGDKQHRLTSIKKITSGSTPEAADFIDALYQSVISAGTHRASSIRVAEAAKVIENTQRDLNIALINELALIFNRLGIDTQEVLEAAGSKWNFLPFRPGLVGGHCIGVDPYYLTHKAQEVGYHPEVILSGRRINDGMGSYVAKQVVKLMTQRRMHVVEANVLIMGLSFKENCPDIRNTRVIDLIREFESFHAKVDVYDPWVDPDDALAQYGISLVKELMLGYYDAVIVAVAHKQFKDMGIEKVRALGTPASILYDVKYTFPANTVDARL
jgi:UDP-N-acetyl-D-galactosamine dehydrogenase